MQTIGNITFPSGSLNQFDDDGPVLPAGQLERMIGKPPSEWTSDDLIEFVREKRIRIIALMHVGADGWLKTLDFVPRDYTHLSDILTGGERADGSSIFAGSGIDTSRSDIVLRPRLSSAFLDPFSAEPTLVLMCGHFGRDGKPLPESPDTILRFAYERVKSKTGVDLHALGEVEYFLGKAPDISDSYGADDRGYHATAPFVFGEPIRRKALAILAEIGIPIKYGHSEVGYVPASKEDNTIWEQHEVELALLPLPEAAEAVIISMWVLRNLAHKNGMRCSFDPIVRKGHAGSGMHFHVSPVVNGEHQNVFNEDGTLVDTSKWLIGGLAQLGGALMAFGNRVEGSFIRLTQGKEAPNTVTWGQSNRKALIRIPIVARNAKGELVSPPTVEFRLPDGSAHPHLLLAGLAQSMIVGKDTENLEEILSQTEAKLGEKNTGGVAKVPTSFPEVVTELEAVKDKILSGAVFPETYLNNLIEYYKGL